MKSIRLPLILVGLAGLVTLIVMWPSKGNETTGDSTLVNTTTLQDVSFAITGMT